jgi:hypothetical protein
MESAESNRPFQRLKQRWNDNIELGFKEEATAVCEQGSTGSR